MGKKDLLVWIDLEMTGLNPSQDVILEAAMIITDDDLNVVYRGESLVIHQPASALHTMSDFVRELHTSSGLLDRIAQSQLALSQVQENFLETLKEYCKPQKSLLCGNSVWQDRAFLAVYMPQVLEYLHYRILDVSSIKEAIRRWYPHDAAAQFKKSDTHRALIDIEESIAELAHYREHFLCERKKKIIILREMA